MMLARGMREIHKRSLRETGLAGIGWEKSAFNGAETRPIPASSVSRRRWRSILRTTGHNFIDQASDVQPNLWRPIGIIASLLTRHRAAPLSQTGPAFCSARFRDAAMRSTTRGSVIKKTMRMRPPQLQSKGSASNIFLIRRAHVLRASLEQSELSRSGSIAAGKPALSPPAGTAGIRPRLE